MVARATLLVLASALLAGCASSNTSTTGTTTPPPTPTPTTPTPTPSPGPDAVVVVQAGFGAYLETTFAGARIHNASTAHTARRIDVHLDVTAGARHIGSTVVHLDALDPGATVPTGGRIQGAAAPGETVAATVSVGGWDAGPVAQPLATAGPATFACPKCGRGAASGDVTVPLTLSAVAPSGLPLNLTAMCTDAAGRIVGGGAQLFVPPAGAGGAVTADIPTVVSAPPADCLVGVAAASI